MNYNTDKKSNVAISVFECDCDNGKKYRLTFDGGDSGNYIIEYCQNCYDFDDKQFMLFTEEIL